MKKNYELRHIAAKKDKVTKSVTLVCADLYINEIYVCSVCLTDDLHFQCSNFRNEKGKNLFNTIDINSVENELLVNF